LHGETPSRQSTGSKINHHLKMRKVGLQHRLRAIRTIMSVAQPRLRQRLTRLCPNVDANEQNTDRDAHAVALPLTIDGLESAEYPARHFTALWKENPQD
ncbi:hypothetical protein, partial [Parvibaculum indicum]|uniref:hypothetical protein n=1 Tax=Parvibaculum indicum TaxID=562969 RepID=UPI001964531E